MNNEMARVLREAEGRGVKVNGWRHGTGDVSGSAVVRENNSPAMCYEFLREAGKLVTLEECTRWPQRRRKAAIDWAIDFTTPFAPAPGPSDVLPPGKPEDAFLLPSGVED